MKITLSKTKLTFRTRGTITAKGYVRLKDAKHRDQYEHRVIAAQARRKPIPATHDIGHHNRLRADNRPANLHAVRHDRHPKVTFKGKSR